MQWHDVLYHAWRRFHERTREPINRQSSRALAAHDAAHIKRVRTAHVCVYKLHTWKSLLMLCSSMYTWASSRGSSISRVRLGNCPLVYSNGLYLNGSRAYNFCQDVTTCGPAFRRVQDVATLI